MNKSKTDSISNGYVTVADLRESLTRRFELIGSYPFERVSGAMSMPDRQEAIRRNYAMLDKRVELGLDDWNRSCPYEIADWLTVLTTPEFGAWQDIRSCGLPLWPRLPVGGFIVSFGNPEAKVALQVGIEYDGVPADELRADHWLKQIGWRAFRVPFERCLRVMDTPSDVVEREGEVSDEYRARHLTETLAGTIQDLRHALIASGTRV
ncbi:very-short-patch-repair endonuclease [Paraburkholderia sp. BL18I3N2]|uniref:hypothetical protein n=1 Tax=Paraburkholderia sp. BL18I3N2 TaxID=1938799 RepID=UPI000D06CD43|nr:hypothetical protein [Paraburkholderia sp. BL18I3N2]PRX32239.1 very-short-patch-repair endonuclease [Paraburkholderia sp. BL18I3N2]